MKLHIADDNGKIVSEVDAEPVCGLSFCDDCGACLACATADPCPERKDGHRWVHYLNKARTLANHNGLAVRFQNLLSSKET
jgi:hypothetical protein